MRAVVQRVLSASVTVDGEVVGSIDGGLLVLLGVTHDDTETEAAWMARKIRDVRILRDERSVGDVGAPVLVVSQFTLYGDARKGRRPTWSAAAPGPVSEPLYEAVCASWSGSAPTSSGASSARTCGSPRSTTGRSRSCSSPPLHPDDESVRATTGDSAGCADTPGA